MQLLGGSSTQFSTKPALNLGYSVPAVLERIEPFQDELVSECIILDGRQGLHGEALRLLTHGLADYDSAIRYCLFGGTHHQPIAGVGEFVEPAHQAELFRRLLDEFLRIEDPSERFERTSDLLARFSSSFDVREVLSLVPDDWSVDILGGFFVHVFRALLSQSREAKTERALSAALNLQVSDEFIEGMEKVGAWLENKDGVVRKLKPEDHGQTPGLVVDGGSDFGDILEAST